MKTLIIFMLYFIIFPVTKSQNAESIIITLEEGQVRGFLSEDQKLYNFLSIPYARAPTGENRFKAPLPPPSWSGILEATSTVRCPQLILNLFYVGQEDCLFINVFVPARAESNNLPVLVFVHGGAFIIGNGDLITGRRLIDQDIIIVTFNYRLGILGYLCLRTDDAPGNAASKDQVAAMRWVQNNIRKFGGNPNDVTLYGTSAGSASVDLLALSSMAEGLFNKIIVESGSAIAGWAMSYDPITDAKTIAEEMGYENVTIDDLKTLADIFKNAPAVDLVRALQRHTNEEPAHTIFRTCIEREIDDSSFLTDSPMRIMMSGNYTHVPVMIIYMNMEGILYVANWYTSNWNTLFRDHFSEFLTKDLSFKSNIEKQEVAETIKQFYISRTETELRAFVDVQTDLLFFYNIIQSARLHSNSAPVYLMEFSYHDTNGVFPGAGHSELYMHVFERWLRGPGGELAADRVTTLFGNFIKYGNPVPSTSELIPVLWPTITSTDLNYLSFGEELTTRKSPLPEQYEFWSDIYNKYYTDISLPDTPDIIDECTVTLEQGQVRGTLSDDQRRCSFLGIPYASVPTGINRLKAPEPPRKWTDTFHATETIMCPQILSLNNEYAGVEECLVINIFKPAGIKIDDGLPVLAFIHGGGFIVGAGDIIQGNRIIDQEVIIVTFNYRLGAIGFICLGTEQAPGNAGLKDQVAALKWIKNNIANFGGNPNDVTLFGSSAGSAAVELLSLSHATEGLFNKIILESGSAIAGWAVSYDPISAAKIIADIMGYTNAENLHLDELVEIYTRATAYELVSAVQQYFNNSVQPFLLAPCIERYTDETSVLSDSPMNILQSSNYTPVTTLVAYMDKEGLMFVSNWNNSWNTTFDESFADFLLPILAFETELERNDVAEKIKQFYLEKTEDDLHAFIDFQTDMYFFHSLLTTTQIRATNSAPVYLMEFSYHDSTNDISGAGHSELYFHVFEISLRGAGGELAADRISKIFGNFIKNGNPIPSTSELLPVSWSKVTPTAVNYLSFAEELTARQSPLPERSQFWSDIYNKYYTDISLPDTPGSIDECDVTIEQGQVRGTLSDDQRRCSFLGIPYASVPTGINRLKAPEPPRKWTDTFHATETIMCPQILSLNNEYAGVEECLVINIFKPAGIKIDDGLPVLAFIHGGGFIVGAGDIIQGNRIIDQEVIIVTFNYRLGAIGFICLGTEQAPGNAGLKDQVAALKWIKNNIANFGGNPNDVTLFGSSAGSAAVELLSLSHATEGLFNKIILESGSAIAGWAVSYDPISAAKIIADIMGYKNAENLPLDELVEIYTRATAYELVSAVQQYFNNSVQPFLLAPCIERYTDETSVLSDSPVNILQSSNYTPVTTLVAYMDKEGLMFVSNWNNSWNTTFDESFADFLLPILAFETELERNDVAEKIKQFYLEKTEDDLHAFIDFQTDMYFFHSLLTTTQIRATNSAPVYLMEFSYHDSTNDISGAGHSELYFHVFEISLRGAGGELAADRITKIFGNFIKYGNPIPSTSELLPVSWPRVTPTAVNYLSFAEELTARQSPLPERSHFWSDIFDKYYAKPLPPVEEPRVSFE